MNTQRLRIGSVPYLNSCVLVHGLAAENSISLEFHRPSLLARKLAQGELDVALASSIECLRHPEYRIVPGLSISGLSEMWSIRLFHRRPLNELKTVALDPASETTNALLQVLLRSQNRPLPRFIMPEGERSRGPDANAIPPDVDGFLLIGDPALTFHHPEWEAWDLQSAWRTLTGRPFVYGLWLARPGVDVNGLGVLLRRCRDEGLRQVDLIAVREAASRGLTQPRAREYVADIVRYELGDDERAGLRAFQRYLLESGIIATERNDI